MVTFMLGKRERGPGILQQRAHRPARLQRARIVHSLRIVRYGSEADVTVSLPNCRNFTSACLNALGVAKKIVGIQARLDAFKA